MLITQPPLSPHGTTPEAPLLELCAPVLAQMYRRDSHTFAYRVWRTNHEPALAGESDRYTAIVLIGLSRCSDDEVRCAFDGDTPDMVLRDLKRRILATDNLGDVALAIWASLAFGDGDVAPWVERLTALYESNAAHATVEAAWSLAALCQRGAPSQTTALRDRLAKALLEACDRRSWLWPHTIGPGAPRIRSHVGCFADQVYPIQALALYASISGRNDALDAAGRCARAICTVQGDAGQWWWHYDVRTGGVIESYPVYAVHQHAMGPMALRDLHEAGGENFSEAIERGMAWLYSAPELDGGSLIDRSCGIIWRKVGRREPRKLVRRMQAAVSSIHPGLRVPGTRVLFPPNTIDHESRPYEYGWMLYAWRGR